jgi:hypothetical protein
MSFKPNQSVRRSSLLDVSGGSVDDIVNVAAISSLQA